MAGYSVSTLSQKLGIKPDTKVQIINPPLGYLDSLQIKNSSKDLDLIQFFTSNKAELIKKFPVLKKEINKSGSIWISWPKGSSKVSTDLNENIIREIGLEIGLVDVKVIAVDEVWSGLKFVYRLKDR